MDRRPPPRLPAGPAADAPDDVHPHGGDPDRPDAPRGGPRGWRALAQAVRLGVGPSPARFIASLLLAAAAVYVFVLGALLTSSMLGRFDLDWGFSGVAAMFAAQGAPMPPVPLRVMGVLLLAAAPLNGAMNVVPALGEEIGWRGFLFPRLQASLGAPLAVLVTGVVWGLWHAPVILLGFNYPGHRWWGLLAMCGFCTLLTGLLAWVSERCGSLWPAAYGHGLVNALVGTAQLTLLRAGSTTDTLHATLLGWSGWFIPAAVVVVLLAGGAYNPRPLPKTGRERLSSAHVDVDADRRR